VSDGTTAGQGRAVHACATFVAPGLEVLADDAELAETRLVRLGVILAGHPRECLSCPDRDGCTREGCTYGNPPETRCCDKFGRCELARVIAHIDPSRSLPVSGRGEARTATVEGRIGREPALCVGCGRCVVACETLPDAGRALTLVERDGAGAAAQPGSSADVGGASSGRRPVAVPREGSLRESGCTFCGQCVIVCPTGALRAVGERGASWLAGRREQSSLCEAVLPPVKQDEIDSSALARVPEGPGVFQLMDAQGRVLRISGAPALRKALAKALEEQGAAGASGFVVEVEPLYTQRESELLALYAQEHGELPPGNDMGDDLF
jgi:predicted molibdopterin-dependent oxidoreductase YjgC